MAIEEGFLVVVKSLPLFSQSFRELMRFFWLRYGHVDFL